MYHKHSYKITVDRMHLATVYSQSLADTCAANLKANGHKVTVRVNVIGKGVK
jgi:hypothetical protein